MARQHRQRFKTWQEVRNGPRLKGGKLGLLDMFPTDKIVFYKLFTLHTNDLGTLLIMRRVQFIAVKIRILEM